MLTAQANGKRKMWRVIDSYNNRMSEIYEWEAATSRIAALSVFGYASIGQDAFVTATEVC